MFYPVFWLPCLKFGVVLAVVVLCQGKLDVVDDDEVVFSLPDFCLNFRRFSAFSVCDFRGDWNCVDEDDGDDDDDDDELHENLLHYQLQVAFQA